MESHQAQARKHARCCDESKHRSPEGLRQVVRPQPARARAAPLVVALVTNSQARPQGRRAALASPTRKPPAPNHQNQLLWRLANVQSVGRTCRTSCAGFGSSDRKNIRSRIRVHTKLGIGHAREATKRDNAVIFIVLAHCCFKRAWKDDDRVQHLRRLWQRYT